LDKEAPPKKSIPYRIGIGFLIAFLLLWLFPFIVPFTPYPTKVKAGIITSAVVIAEVMFLLGALLVGKEVAIKFKRYLNPKSWRKKQ
jgi:hypothetical protein